MKTKQQHILYNGWRGSRKGISGRATWNVSLWLNNDEPLYRTMVEFVRTHVGRITSFVAEEFVKELLPKGTPDLNWKLYYQVHWASIAGMMRELLS